MAAVSRPGIGRERSSPSRVLETITDRDTDLDPIPIAIHVAVSGTFAWKNQGNEDTEVAGTDESMTVSAGQVLTFEPLQILSTTTATVMGYRD